MADFVPNATTLRSHDLFEIVQTGGHMQIVSKSARVKACAFTTAVTVAEVEANPQHRDRSIVSSLKSAGYVAYVRGEIDGKYAQIGLTAADYAKGADERARYAAWLSETSARNAAGRAFWDGVNEGGEGFNPYR